jgi:hypothetical protein
LSGKTIEVEFFMSETLWKWELLLALFRCKFYCPAIHIYFDHQKLSTGRKKFCFFIYLLRSFQYYLTFSLNFVETVKDCFGEFIPIGTALDVLTNELFVVSVFSHQAEAH